MNQPVSTSSQPAPPAAPAPSPRLLSLDALRGFDMFWIVGGEGLIHGLYKALPIAPVRLLENQMDHKAWAGVAFYDLIFPLFVFMVGVSIVFSLPRMIERAGKAAAFRRILFRSVVMYIFGLLIYGGISKGLDQVRWMGVLQRIAICYLVTSTAFCVLPRRGLVALCAALLVGYWGLMSFTPIRDFNLETGHLAKLSVKPDSPEARALFDAATNRVTGRFEDGLNLAQQIDFQYLPGRKWDGAYDPEGILSTLPAVATCLLGVFAGFLLRNGNMADAGKVARLAAAGVAGVALGFLWGQQFPVIKKIWTSSYVLVAGGYSCLFLAAFYQVIEIWRWRKWCTPFVWIGTNAITIYMVFHVIEFSRFAERIVGGPVKAGLGAWGPMLVSVTVVALMLALVRFLYQRKIFLRL